MIGRYLHDVIIGIEAIFANKLKSLLTALGIIFGVAAVISMLAIGAGAQQEILEQIKMVGVNNIIISPTAESKGTNDNEDSTEDAKEEKRKFSKGLSLLDLQAIDEVIPGLVEQSSPVISFNYPAILNGKSRSVILEGVASCYFSLFNMDLQLGRAFSKHQEERGSKVCVIGDNVRKYFFNQENPVGKYIKCGGIWLKVVGVVERRDFTASASDEMGISSSDNKIFIPARTLLNRYKDRALIRADEVQSRGGENKGGKKDNLNQLDKLVVQVKETEQLSEVAEILRKMMLRRHNEVQDFEITIPELLLKQQQRTQDIFSIVLGAIASISLIVGGIGIMNIMLASVMERIKEIGTRQAIGASKKDVIVQFLSESTIISLSGGIVGIILGVFLAKLITYMSDIQTVISFFGILISFGVSVFVGILFGFLPAKKAAEQDPVISLRQ